MQPLDSLNNHFNYKQNGKANKLAHFTKTETYFQYVNKCTSFLDQFCCGFEVVVTLRLVERRIVFATFGQLTLLLHVGHFPEDHLKKQTFFRKTVYLIFPKIVQEIFIFVNNK